MRLPVADSAGTQRRQEDAPRLAVVACAAFQFGVDDRPAVFIFIPRRVQQRSPASRYAQLDERGAERAPRDRRDAVTDAQLAIFVVTPVEYFVGDQTSPSVQKYI